MMHSMTHPHRWWLEADAEASASNKLQNNKADKEKNNDNKHD